MLFGRSSDGDALPLLQPALGRTSTPPPVVAPVALVLVPPAPMPLELVSFADVVAPPAPPWLVVAVLPGPALLPWPVVPPIVPAVEPPSVEDDVDVDVALLLTGVPPLVALVFEALALEPTVLDPVPLDSDVFEVAPAADVVPSFASELQPELQPTRARSAARAARRGASAL